MENTSLQSHLDTSDEIVYKDISDAGINESVVRKISESNNDPAWMLELRLKALEVFKGKSLPNWGPDLSGLDLDSIRYFAKADVEGDRKSWEDVPDDIKRTFDRLGIPEAEKAMLA